MLSLREIVNRNGAFSLLASGVAITLFLPAGFISVAVVIFSLFMLLTMKRPALAHYTFNDLLLPMLLFGLYAVGILYSENSRIALDLLFRKIPLLLLPLMFFLSIREYKSNEFNLILFVFLCSAILASVVCYGVAGYKIIATDSILYPSDHANSYLFAYDALANPIDFDPIYLSLFINFAFAICLFTNTIQKSSWRILTGTYLAIFIFMLASKIGIATLILLLILRLVDSPNKGKLIMLSAVCLIIVFWVGVVKFPFLKERFKITVDIPYSEVDSGKWGSTAFRIAIWSCTLETIGRNPILGYGTGDGQAALEATYYEKNFIRGFTDHYNAHNELFSTTLDLGILGLILLMLVLFVPLIRSIRFGDRLVTAFMILMILTLLVESAFLRQRAIVFFSFFFPLLYCRMTAGKQESVDTSVK